MKVDLITFKIALIMFWLIFVVVTTFIVKRLIYNKHVSIIKQKMTNKEDIQKLNNKIASLTRLYTLVWFSLIGIATLPDAMITIRLGQSEPKVETYNVEHMSISLNSGLEIKYRDNNNEEQTLTVRNIGEDTEDNTEAQVKIITKQLKIGDITVYSKECTLHFKPEIGKLFRD